MEEEKEEKGIRLSENYILKNDNLNLILETWGYKKPAIKDLKKAKQEGVVLQEKWGLIGQHYFHNVKQVFNHILDENIIKNLSEVNELKNLVDVCEEVRSMFNQFKKTTKLNKDSLEVLR